MKTADAIWMCLPEGLDELFEIVRFEKTARTYDIWLDEKKKRHGGRGTLAAAIPGTKSDEIISTLIGAMGKSLRRKVKEVTCDLSPSMMLIAGEVFYNAYVVNDRFHV